MELSEHARVNRDAWNVKAVEDVALAERQWATRRDQLGHLERSRGEVGALPDVDGKDVVELGCGTAYVSAWLARRGARPVGIDVSENQLATARAMQAKHGLEFPLHHASAEDVPLPDDCADFVISEYGASLWCDPDAWLAEAARLLRPGGDLVFLTNSLMVTLCAPDVGAATTGCCATSAGCGSSRTRRGGRRVPPRARGMDRHARPSWLHGERAARALRAGRRPADQVRVGHAGVGAPLAGRGDLGGDVEVLTARRRRRGADAAARGLRRRGDDLRPVPAAAVRDARRGRARCSTATSRCSASATAAA